MEQVTMWRAVDGQLLQSASQCAAYELKRQMATLGKAMDDIKFNQFGQIDVDAVNAVASSVQDQLNAGVAAVQSAIATEQAASAAAQAASTP